MAELPGRVGPYEITREIGRGGMGVVYLARDTKLDRDVAIKALPPELADDAERLTRFEREAKTLAQLNHTNIAGIHGIEEQDGQKYLILEYLEGRTLGDLLQRGGLPWKKAVRIAAAIAEALAAAHAKGVVHRDIKPDNVMITDDGQVKVLDFGLARTAPTDGADTGGADTLPAGTEPGLVMGTPGYLSPEQVRGERADARSDIFSFGCILHEMLSGQRLYARESKADSFAATLNEDPPDLLESAINAPTELCRIAQRCLEKNPDQRFQSARDLAYTLEDVLTDASVSAPSSAPTSRPARLIALAMLILVVGIALVAYLLRPSPDGPTGAIKTVAVLPLEIEGADPDASFLAEEIPASIIDSLTTISALRVVPRDTAFRHGERGDDATVAGRELGADYVLTGRIITPPGGLRVRAELIDVATNSQTWSQRYDSSLENTVAVEKEITGRIVESLRVRLTGDEQTRLERRRTDSPEAHLAYLEGRFWWNRRSEPAIVRSIELYEKALEIDPDFALAYAGIADSYCTLGWAYRDPNDTFPRARDAAETALAIDPNLAEAYPSLGWVRTAYEWDFESARRAFEKAIELNPRYATAHSWRSIYLGVTGQIDAALASIVHARELDPGSLIINSGVGFVYYQQRDYESACRELERVREMDPSFFPAWQMLGLVYVRLEQYDEAIQLYESLYEHGRVAANAGQYGLALALAGREDEAREELRILHETARERYIPPSAFALVHGALGEFDEAFAWLEKAIDGHDRSVLGLAHSPTFDELRGDPRLAELSRRIGLEPMPWPPEN